MGDSLPKLLNSVWILFSFIGGAWIGFLIIGKRAKEPKWIKLSLIYAIGLWGTFLIGMCTPSGSDIGTAFGMTWMGLILVSIVHSFVVNRKYLICREILEDAKQDQKDQEKLKEEIVQHYKQKGIITNNNIKRETAEETPIITKAEPQKGSVTKVQNEILQEKLDDGKVNINTCTEAELAKLPGISVVVAKKAIEYRNIQNGFLSIEEFYAIADVKPHFVVQLNDLIVCEDGTTSQRMKKETDSNAKTNEERKGRILDI